MGNDTNTENQKEINKMHTKFSLMFLIFTVVICLLLGATAGAIGTIALTEKPSKADSVKKEATAALKETAKDDISKALSKEKKNNKANQAKVLNEKYPTYTVELREEPTITMWEFTHALTELDAAAIGTAISSLNDERTDFSIVFMKEKSLVSSEYNYYLCIKGYWEEEYICFAVNEITIDDVWNTLRLHIEDWNHLTEDETFEPAEYNKFQALTNYLKEVCDDYEVRDIPAKYFVVKGELLTSIT